ncbi:MAG: TrkH family potassium uptake protein [Deltaproteobacteria bacterium]|nr:TrkH family potassium uptake protein [Deltaproteobacteria bacterium]
MNLPAIIRILSILLGVVGVAVMLPALVALNYGEDDWKVFLTVGGSVAATGAVVSFLFRRHSELRVKDGFLLVTLVWLTAPMVGALPFYFLGTFPSYIDALFEAVSGFSTTGASVLVDFDHTSHAVYFWRSLILWIGGMGIIVLGVVILPTLGISGMHLFRREVSGGPMADKMTPRLRDTAMATWSIYAVLTAAQTTTLFLLGMPLFDAVNHSMATMATAGFGVKADSFAGYNSPAIEWATIFFMAVAATNFSLHYFYVIGRGNLKVYLKDREFRWFMVGLTTASLAVSLYLFLKAGYGWEKALTKGTFQVVSIMSTTGFASDDFALWGPFPQLILFLSMIVGGMAGSTAGAVKWMRVMLMFKFIRVELIRLLHPRVVVHAKIGHAQVTPAIINNVFAFFFLYMTVLAFSTLALTWYGIDLVTAASAVATCLGGVGPGFGSVGPMGNFSAMPDGVKLILSGDMILGRLELMTAMALFLPQYWTK